LIRLEQRGFTTAIVWAVRDNARARRFYRQHGFHLDDEGRETWRRGEAYAEIRLSAATGTRPASALIVAQSPQFRESLAVLMRAVPQIGRIRQAADAASALSENGETPPDLILCDFGAARDATVETLRRIRAQWPHARCVVLVQDRAALQRAQDLGADVVLTKGVLAARLLEAVEQLLSGSHGAETRRAARPGDRQEQEYENGNRESSANASPF
jgi:DNA-binding NarL/FixJ family response regulator